MRWAGACRHVADLPPTTQDSDEPKEMIVNHFPGIGASPGKVRQSGCSATAAIWVILDTCGVGPTLGSLGLALLATLLGAAALWALRPGGKQASR